MASAVVEEFEAFSPRPVLIAIVASLAAFMEVLDTTITNVSLTQIAGSLAASQNESTWVLTSYLVANGIVLPLSGWLAEVMGRKTFFMSCIAAFTASSLACGMATSLEMLIFFRLVQGLAGGGLQPMQQAIVMDAFPPQKRGAAFAITGITIVVAPILGPTLGGYITDNFSWRWIFFMNVPIGVMAVFLTKVFVSDPPHAEAKGAAKVDFVGLGLLALGLGALQIVLDKGQDEDWFSSNFILITAMISGASLIGGVLWLLRQTDPIVDLRLLADKYFGPSSLIIFCVGFTLYGSAALLPLLLQTQFGYDATLAGLVLSPGGLTVIITMAIVGKLSSRFQARYLTAIGMGLCSLGMIATASFTPQTDYGTFVMFRMLQVIGLPFMFVPISAMAFSSVPKEQSGKASALFSLMRNLGGSFGISLILTYVARREQLHQSVLAAHLAPTDPVFQALLAAASKAIADMGALNPTATAFGMMYKHLVSQALILSYADAFWVFAVMLGLLGVGALFLPKNKVHEEGADEVIVAH
jgi:DHA2 family multidrug resistance protein